MAEFEDKLNSILSNPQMMQQIMSMAGSFGQQQTPPPPPPQQPNSGTIPFDPAAMQSMMQLIRGTQLDQRQQNLLGALGAYLPREKVIRLQKDMQASAVAKFASAALNQNGKGG